MKCYYVARATGTYLTDMLIAHVDIMEDRAFQKLSKAIKGYVEKGYQVSIKCVEEEDA